MTDKSIENLETVVVECLNSDEPVTDVDRLATLVGWLSVSVSDMSEKLERVEDELHELKQKVYDL